MSTVTLAYHDAAREEVDRVTAAVERLGWSVGRYTCGVSQGPGALGERLATVEGHVLLFLNDDLLHATNCQVGLLEAYRRLRSSERLHCVLASSTQAGPGGEARVLTTLARVSDVVRYMNYWQHAYLEQRRAVSAGEAEASELERVRVVSQEIGETLRLVRADGYAAVHELTEADSTVLHRWLGEGPHPAQAREPGPDPDPEPESEPEPEPGIEVELASEPGPEQDTVADSVATISALAAAVDEVEDEGGALHPDAPESQEEPVERNEGVDVSAAVATVMTQVDLGDAGAEPDPARERKRVGKSFLKRLRKSDPESAFDYGRRQLGDDPDNYRLRYLLAIALLSDGSGQDDVDEAIELLAGLTDSGYAARAHAALGTVALAERDYGSARRHLEHAYALDQKTDRELTYRLGALLQDEFPESRKAARKYLREATKRSKRNAADAWYRLAKLERGRKRAARRKVARSLKTALSLDPGHPFAAYDLATLYLERGRIARATRYFRRAVRANPELDTLANRQAFAPPTPELESDGFDRYLAKAQQRSPLSTLEPLAPARVEAETKPVDTTIDDLLAEEWRERQLTVLITGATSGIGAATAAAFARGGHRLILTGRRVERLREASVALHEAHDTSVRLLSFDVTNLQETSELLSTLPPDWREVDILINNAGKAKGLDPIHQGRLEHWEEMIDTNVKGLLYMTRMVTPGMVKRGRGHVINVCSTAGHEVYPKGAVYCATKHAVDAITRGTRLDLHEYGIRVSQVSPAHVEETEFARVRFDGDGERAAGVYEGFQPLRATDVARAIYFMATQPPHVNVQDVLMMGTQQASSTVINRSGR